MKRRLLTSFNPCRAPVSFYYSSCTMESINVPSKVIDSKCEVEYFRRSESWLWGRLVRRARSHRERAIRSWSLDPGIESLANLGSRTWPTSPYDQSPCNIALMTSQGGRTRIGHEHCVRVRQSLVSSRCVEGRSMSGSGS